MNEQVITNTAVKTAGGIGDIILWLIIIVALLGIMIFFINFVTYLKKKVILYEKVNSGTRFRIFLAKEVKDKKTDIPKWKLWGIKKTFARPPNESIFQDDKGKLIAQGFYVDENIVWVKPDFRFDNESLDKIGFEPFLSEDKSVAVHEFRESENYKKKTMGEFILNALPMITIIIIIAMFFIFFGQIVEPSVDMGNKLVESQEKMNQVITKLDVLINDRPIPVENQIITNGKVPN